MMMADVPDTLAPDCAIPAEPDWTPVDPFPPPGTTRSFVSGDPAGPRLRVAYFRRARDGMLVARVWFGPGTEGPPGYAHGGSIAAALDEAMGASAWMANHASVAARLQVAFLEMVPLGTSGTIEAWVAGVEGRKVTTRARLVDAGGTALAEGEALFVILPEDMFKGEI